MLRKALDEAGFRGPARQVSAAIRRRNQSWVERLAFDWTCEWGANFVRPLELIAAVCGLCTLLYWASLHFGKRSGLYLASTGQRIRTYHGKERVFHLRFRPPRPARWSRYLPRLLARELRALGTAFLFSLMSVFNLGFRDFDFGQSIRLMQTREFDLRARGWIRCVSGVQSLLGVALIALSLLSYFGHPFD